MYIMLGESIMFGLKTFKNVPKFVYFTMESEQTSEKLQVYFLQ